jgi:hypothetical protein
VIRTARGSNLAQRNLASVPPLLCVAFFFLPPPTLVSMQSHRRRDLHMALSHNVTCRFPWFVSVVGFQMMGGSNVRGDGREGRLHWIKSSSVLASAMSGFKKHGVISGGPPEIVTIRNSLSAARLLVPS